MKRSWLPPVSRLRATFVLIVPAGIIVSGLLLPFRLPAAFLAPAAMLALLRRKLDSAPNRRTAAGIVIAATAGTVLSALALLLAAGYIGPFWGLFLFGWFTWLLPPVLIGAAGYRFYRQCRTTRSRAAAVIGFAALAWVVQGLHTFDWRKPVGNGDPEIYDDRGRLGVLYPGAGTQSMFVCEPRGPHFLWSVDFDGSEWIYRVFRPHIEVWFWLYRDRIYEL